MFDVPTWSMINNPYYAHTSGRDTVLITVGDSWTYGDSLGNTKVRNGLDDTDYRLTHVYGYLTSQQLGSDWINLALPGGSNTLMLDWLSALLPTVEHKIVICTITLTESGRHEDIYNLAKHPTQQAALTTIVNSTYNKIRNIKSRYPTIKFVVAHNFTDPVPNELTCERSWLEVMLEKKISNSTHLAVSEYIEQMNSKHRYPDVLEVIDRAEKRITLMDNCAHCNKEDSRHPTEQGHVLWSKYIMAQL